MGSNSQIVEGYNGEDIGQNVFSLKKKGLPFWSPERIIKMFWAGRVELSKMRQSLRASEEETRLAGYLYGRDHETGETREESEILNCCGLIEK